MLRMACCLSSLVAALSALVLPGGVVAAADRTIVNPRSAYPEGPLFRDGVLYYAEMGDDRVMRWNGETNAVFWSRPGCAPTSVARGGGGELLVLCHSEAVVVRLGPDGETLGLVDADADGRSFVNPNASINDAKGGLYFSSSGRFAPNADATGAVLYLYAGGRLIRVAEGIHYANGVALAANGHTLFVSEHLSRNVLAFDVADDGTLSNRRVFLKLDAVVGADADRSWEVGPDGLAVDRKDNLYIAEYGGGRVLVVDRRGALLKTIAVPEAYVTAIAFSDDQRRLYITAPASMMATDGKVYSIDNPVAQAD